MKTPTHHRRGGFTLVELLVVIAIIAVLAAAGFAAGGAAMKKAKMVKAESVAQSVNSAIDNFYTENSALPIPQGSGGTDGGTKYDTSKGDGIKVLEILTGLDDEINTRRVKYLAVKEGKAKKDGIIFSKSGKEVVGLFDPWGNPYIIVMDTSYEDRINVKPGNSQTTLNGKRSAVYTVGQDKKGGTKDDVKTW